MMLHKHCPRCHGDLFLEYNLYHGYGERTWNWKCLQCSRVFIPQQYAGRSETGKRKQHAAA